MKRIFETFAMNAYQLVRRQDGIRQLQLDACQMSADVSRKRGCPLSRESALIPPPPPHTRRHLLQVCLPCQADVDALVALGSSGHAPPVR